MSVASPSALRATRTPHAAIPAWVVMHPIVRENRTLLHTYAAMYLDADFGKREGSTDWQAISRRTGLARATIYRDLKKLEEIGAIHLVQGEHYLMPMDDPSITVDSLSTTVDKSSTTVDCTVYTEDSESTRVDQLRGFDIFWQTYPARAGRKIGKDKAAIQWRKLPLADKRAAYRAAQVMAAEVSAGRTLPPDAFRWLRDGTWRDWLAPVEAEDEPMTASERERRELFAALGMDPE